MKKFVSQTEKIINEILQMIEDSENDLRANRSGPLVALFGARIQALKQVLALYNENLVLQIRIERRKEKANEN